MPLYLKDEQFEHLKFLRDRPIDDVIEMCKSALEYLMNGPNQQRYNMMAKKYSTNSVIVLNAVEALISLLIDATKADSKTAEIHKLCCNAGFDEEFEEILIQFLTNKRNFMEGAIKTANIRAYRLVNLEWRLEVRIASRSLLQQSNTWITMKLFMHTEPKNENRDLLEFNDDGNDNIIIHPDERRNRRDLIVQTDLNSLIYMIKVLEDALFESRSRRVKNIVDAIY